MNFIWSAGTAAGEAALYLCVWVFQGHCDGSLLDGLQQLPFGHAELLAGVGEL